MDQPRSNSSNQAVVISSLIFHGPSTSSAGEKHLDSIFIDEDGCVNPEELIAIVALSHHVQVDSLKLRYKDHKYGAWAPISKKRISAHRDKTNGGLVVEVQANVVQNEGLVIIPLDRKVSPLILGRFSQQENKVNFKEGIVRGTNDVIPPGKDRKDTRKKQKDSNSSSNSSTVGLAQSPKLKLWNELAELSDEGSSSEEDNFALLTEVPNGKIDESWLIVERSGDVPLAPNERREERLIGGRKAFVETYRALFQAGLHWFGENEKAENHPKNSRRIFGSEGGIAITPEKLVSRIRGLALYLDDSQRVDRFVLFLASRKSSFLPEESANVYRRKSTGSWKPCEGGKWKELSRKVPELSVLDHSWEDPPGNYWNVDWHCMVQLIVQKKDKGEDPDTICLAAVRFIRSGGTSPKNVKKQNNKAKIPLKVAPYSDLFLPTKSAPHPKLEPFYSPSALPNNHSTGRVPEASKVWIPPPSSYPEIQISLLPNGQINWNDPKTKQEFQNMATLLRKVERTLSLNPLFEVRSSPSQLLSTDGNLSSDLGNLLTYLDRLLPISVFLESSNFSKGDYSHRLPENIISLEEFKMKFKGISRKILDTVYAAFLKEIKSPEIGLSYYSSTGVLEDLLSQLYRFYGMTPPHGNSPQVPVFFCSPKGIPFFASEVQSPQENFEFQIPEMPGPPQARKLEYFLRRLMFPGYSSPHMGETFKSVRSDVLLRNLKRIGCQDFRSIEVAVMSWPELESNLIRWIQQMAVLIYVLLPKERQLCETVLSGTPQFEQYPRGISKLGAKCFFAIARFPLQWILNIGKTMASSPKHPEKVFLLLQMYCLVDKSLTHIRETFRGKGESHVEEMLKEFLTQVVEIVKATLEEFRNCIEEESEKLTIKRERVEMKQSGGLFRSSGRNSGNNEQQRKPIRVLSNEIKEIVQVSPLTSYVLNYLNTLCSTEKGFPEILRHVFSSQESEKSKDSFPADLQVRFHCIFVTLKNTLEEKSTEFSNEYLRLTFFLNNLTYICIRGTSSESLSALSKPWVDMAQVEIHKTVKALVKLLLEKALPISTDLVSCQLTKTSLICFICISHFHLFISFGNLRQMEMNVFKDNLRNEKEVLHALMLFNSEFVSLLSNKVIQLISDDSIQSLACRSILTRVSDGYKKFLESYRHHIVKNMRSNFLTAEQVEQRLRETFLFQS